MKKHYIYIDEGKPKISELQKLETLLGTNLPEEYRNFIFRNNGCTIQPNVPKIEKDSTYVTWGIERFLSIGDLILQKQTKTYYTNEEAIKEYDSDKYKIDIHKLLTIAIAERGCYHIYLGYEEYGQIYFSNYSDGDGLVRFETDSFDEFINSLGYYDEEIEPIFFDKPTKIFNPYLFETFENSVLGFNRFQEVLEQYGDPNFFRGDGYKNVVQTYVDNKQFLLHIIEKGGKVEGLLNYTNNYNTITFLIEHFGLDINSPYKGRYPLQVYTAATSMNDYKISYELMDQLLQSNYKLNLLVTDENGNNITDRLKIIANGYNDYIEYTKRKGYYEKIHFIRSKVIEDRINEKRSKENWVTKIFKKNKNES